MRKKKYPKFYEHNEIGGTEEKKIGFPPHSAFHVHKEQIHEVKQIIGMKKTKFDLEYILSEAGLRGMKHKNKRKANFLCIGI